MSRKKTRREFLSLLGAVAGGMIASARLMGAGRPGGAARALDGAESDARDKLARLVDDPDAARAIGQEYLRTRPAEADPDALTRWLYARLDLSTAHPGSREELRRRLSDAAAEDFRRGDMACVDGWMLSLSESRLCAALALA